MSVTAQDINSRFEETSTSTETQQQQGAGAGSQSQEAPKDEEKKLLDDAAKATADAGKSGGAQLPEDIAKELEELRAYKQQNAPKVEETPEQKADREKQYQTQLHQFALEKGFYSAEDLGKLEALKTQADNDVVYSNFKENFKTINPNASDEDIKEAFDTHYHLNSENKHLKKLGESRLQNEAKSYRNPYETKFESAKKEFDIQRNIDAKVPDFDIFLQKIVKDFTPDQWTVFKTKDGDEEIPINLQLTEEDRKNAIETLRTSANFGLFLQNPQQATESLQKQLDSHNRLTHNDKINKIIFDSGVSRGTKKGSTTGADNAFPIASQKHAANSTDTSDMAELAKSDDIMRDRRNR